MRLMDHEDLWTWVVIISVVIALLVVAQLVPDHPRPATPPESLHKGESP